MSHPRAIELLEGWWLDNSLCYIVLPPSFGKESFCREPITNMLEGGTLAVSCCNFSKEDNLGKESIVNAARKLSKLFGSF